jgi:DNA-binding XRE family transcriptional regulator
MAIVWTEVAKEIRRRRERAGITQDVLASKVGVRWNTIARVETGRRRPSLELLEKLALQFKCRIRDLLREEGPPMRSVAAEREPSMLGAPSYFRYGIAEASGAKKVVDAEGRTARMGYDSPAWHLAIHLDEYISDEAREELDTIFEVDDDEDFERQFLAFLKREFPGCMALVPTRRYRQFLKGFYDAMEDSRFPWSRE